MLIQKTTYLTLWKKMGPRCAAKDSEREESLHPVSQLQVDPRAAPQPLHGEAKKSTSRILESRWPRQMVLFDKFFFKAISKEGSF